MHSSRIQRGFTFAELLIVVVILAIASALVVPLVTDDESIGLRAAAELLASDIEEVQTRTLADPGSPMCLIPHEDGSGWHIGLVDNPNDPITGIDGQLRIRTFGIGALVGAKRAHLQAPDLPVVGLTFDDQGAPTLTDSTLCFEITGHQDQKGFAVLLSNATGRVSIQR